MSSLKEMNLDPTKLFTRRNPQRTPQQINKDYGVKDKI